jgi:hypothetical protein
VQSKKQSFGLRSRSACITATQCAPKATDQEQRIREDDLSHGGRCRRGQDAGLVLLLLLLLQCLLHQERLLLLLPESLLLLLVARPGAVHLLLLP